MGVRVGPDPPLQLRDPLRCSAMVTPWAGTGDFNSTTGEADSSYEGGKGR